MQSNYVEIHTVETAIWALSLKEIGDNDRRERKEKREIAVKLFLTVLRASLEKKNLQKKDGLKKTAREIKKEKMETGLLQL